MRIRSGMVIIGSVAVIAGISFVAYRGTSHHPAQAKNQVLATNTNSTAPASDSTSTEQPQAAPKSTDPNYSTSDPSSIWVVVNKQRALPATFVPNDLVSVGSGQQMRTEAASAVKNLVAAAAKANVPLKYISGYRSYAYQQTVYGGYVKQSGQAAADTFSARPGHSEHQTGLAMDLGNSNGSCDLDTCFGTTTGGKWVAAHAYQYGFIIRYESNTTSLTGYQYEPWHVRYVGTWLAQKLHDHPETLEQYFTIPAATGY